MEPLICSLSECRKEILGSGVVLGSAFPDEPIDFEGANLLRYNGSNAPFALVHPTCFLQLFDEFVKIEDGHLALTVLFGSVGDIRIALAM